VWPHEQRLEMGKVCRRLGTWFARRAHCTNRRPFKPSWTIGASPIEEYAACSNADDRQQRAVGSRNVTSCYQFSAGADRECAPEAIARIGRVRFGTFREYSATGTVGAQLKSSERAEHGGP